MQKEAQEYVKKCDQCQKFAPNIHQPGGILNPLSSPWLFAQWGLDIVGPCPKVEAVNKVIVNGLKKRLDETKGNWVEELPHVLWTYRTTPRRSTGETPFSMTYGVEAVIPLETGFPTLKTSFFTPSYNDEMLEKGLVLIEERRENAMVQLAYDQHKLKQGYDSNVRLRPLVPGDLILRKVLGTAKNLA
ncbi:uncharacterized protein LOC142624794 [Castanea sativa]|uniref:uncharacterized protein LOC142624794 n=1 Tax=Castanea sativa TaxID=21020 RepID=UPI003F653577